MPSSWYKEFMSGYGFDIGSRKPNPRHYAGPPMDLANMRQLGVRALQVRCLDCRREVDVNVDAYDGSIPVPSFRGRLVCKCGSKRTDVRPAWHTVPTRIPHPR